tara:strand:- start:416 stop:1807 length:1392 start_codon:yes stop_codon:yes gene_type:complete
MKILRLLEIFFTLRSSGIFHLFVDGFNPFLKQFARPKDIENKFKKSLENLGPVFIKLGQLLSTRTDLISQELASNLKELTDSCEPIDFSYIKEELKRNLGQRADTLLKNIDAVPLASASLAQVHRVTLNNEELVVKVQRPGLEKQIQRDIDALRFAVKALRFFYKGYPRVDLNLVVNDYEKVITNELDFRLEAANAKKTFSNFAHSSFLYVPRIHDEFTTKKTLVMEYIDGEPITNVSNLRAYGLDLKKLSENGVQIFLKQVFEDNFFHADMHPGNIFAAKDKPNDPYYYAVDYAICGSLTESNQILLAQMISCLLDRDFFSLAQLFIFAEWVDEKTKTEDLEAVLRANCESLLDKPLNEILFGELLLNLFDGMKQFDLFLDNDLILLVKTLIHIEGMGRQIYPDLDFWSVAGPFIKKWLKDKYSVKGLIKYLVSKKHILTYMILKKIEESKYKFSEETGEEI